MKHRLLLVEDDESFGYILKEYLMLHDFEMTWIKDGNEAIRRLNQESFDLCILDIMLPGADGFTVASSLREHGGEIPFLFLTARSLKVDKLKGFRLGCDDYEVKPVDEELLLAKINAILARTSRSSPSSSALTPTLLSLGAYQFDIRNQTLTFAGASRILTDRETELLQLLYAHRNELLDRKKVLKEVWGVADLFSRKSMDVFISRLRKYLSDDPSIRIINVHNKGFIMKVG